MRNRNENISILSVAFKNASKKELLKVIDGRLKKRIRTLIFTPNTQILLKASKDRNFLNILNNADINIPDGTGVLIAAKILGTRFRERVSGIDMGEALIALAARAGYSIFFLGGKKGRAEKSARKFRQKYPSLKISGCHNGYFSKTGDENDTVLKIIASSDPDILFVGLGSPMQEEWILKHIDSLPSVKLAIGLGGSFDVWSENIRRAPSFMREAGLEWLWRLVLEPRRARILYDIPVFLSKIKK